MTVWIKPYHRDHMEGLDHAGFGVELGSVAITEPRHRAKFGRTIVQFPHLHMPASQMFDGPARDDRTRHVFSPCEASFAAAYTEPLRAHIFSGDHAVLATAGGQDQLLEESLWHSDLFFSEWFRIDRSTEWRWRYRRDWDHSVHSDRLVNNAYHRYSYQYFHWFMDCLPRIWLLKTRSPFARPDKWLVGPLTQPFHLPALALFDISADDCMPLCDGQIMSFDNLVCPGFRFEEDIRTLRPDFRSGVGYQGWSQDYLAELRDRALRRLGVDQNQPCRRLYVERRDASHRTLHNAGEIGEFLDAFGFTRVTPGELSFAEQVSLFASAREIIAIHGAGLTNMIWAPPGCTVLELQPAGLGDVGYRFLAQLLGHQHAVMICPSLAHPQGIPYADIEPDIDLFRHAVTAMF